MASATPSPTRVTRRWQPRSLLQLLLIGFAVVTTPLVVALGVAAWHVDRLAGESQAEIYRAVAATETTGELSRMAARLERASRQYILFGREEIIERYRTYRQAFHTDLRRFDDSHTRPPDRGAPRLPTPEPTALAIGEITLFITTRVDDGPREVITPLLQHLHRNVAALGERNYERIHEGVRRTEELSDRAQQVVFVHLAAAVPLTLAFTLFFARQIHQPIRRMGAFIRQLGVGRFNEPLPLTEATSGPRDLASLNEQLEWLRRRLELLESEREQFIRHVSHELKTPLAAVLEATDLLQSGTMGELSRPQQEVAGILRNNGQSLRELIDRMLRQAQARDFGSEEESSPLALNEVVTSVLEAHDLVLRRRQLRVVRDLEPVLFHGRRNQLLSVVDNVISNAIKHSPERGTIRVDLQRHNDEQADVAILSVSDEGEGIDPGQQATVFEPYARDPDAGYGLLPSSGLGLALARDYVQRHGGSIEADTAFGGGALIRIRLPLDDTRTSVHGLVEESEDSGTSNTGERSNAADASDH